MRTQRFSAMHLRKRRHGCSVSGLLAAAVLFAAGSASAADAPALGDLSLEELMNETITSVSKKTQNLFDSAAAVTVLSNDDLRRSGATHIADALRLVPGLNLGSMNASQWAISARGFNTLYANKLLVLIDGRAVYTPLFAGVYWDLQQPMLEDIERIEVIRGPGATVWGANAVNGVINIITKSAGDTQGGLAYASAGAPQEVSSGARYGGRLGADGYYRVFASYQRNDDFPAGDGSDADDRWQGWTAGFKLDRYADDARLTWQADVSATDLDAHTSDAYNVNTLGRWTRAVAEASNVEVQAYYDRLYRKEREAVLSVNDTLDLSAQHTFPLGERNDVIWGLGYRFINTLTEPVGVIAEVRDRHLDQQLFSAFAQNEYAAIPDKLDVTAGVKLEHNDFTGFEVQPSLRAALKLRREQTLWAAVSRAVRTPRVLEGADVFAIKYGAPFVGPGGGLYVPTLVGNLDVESEVLWAYELGYRVQPGARLNLDIAGFYNDYSGIIGVGAPTALAPGAPVGRAEIPWRNLLNGETYGGELLLKYSPQDTWRLTATYAYLTADLRGSTPMDAIIRERSTPVHQAGLQASHDLRAGLSVDTQLRYVGEILGVQSYFTADLRLSYQVSERLELTWVGRNLLQRRHAEQAPLPASISAEAPRSFHAKLTGRF